MLFDELVGSSFKVSLKRFKSITIDLNSLLLANVSSFIVAVPVIPVPHSESKDVLVLEEGETVLAVPVIGLVPHPVKPLHLCACGVPPPVSPVVFAVRSHTGGSNPPLSIPLHPGPSRLAGHYVREESLDSVVLGRAPGLVHIHKVTTPCSAEDLSIGLGHSLLQTSEVDTLHRILDLNLAPAIGTRGSLSHCSKCCYKNKLSHVRVCFGDLSLIDSH